MGRVAYQLQLIVRPDTELALVGLARDDAGDVDLNPIRAVFDLTADFLDDLVLVVDRHVVTGHALVCDQASRRAADTRDQGIRAT